MALVVSCGCEGANQPTATASATVVASAAIAETPAAEAKPPLDQAALARLNLLARRFARGKACDTDALAELQALEVKHGDPDPLRKALLIAYQACDEPEATARLLERTLPSSPTTQQLLEVGASWIRAASYEEAVRVLAPVAKAEGPTSKAAWLAGFALFHAGRAAEALPLLQSARAHASAPDGSDAFVLIGLAHLDAGDTNEAIAELERGRGLAPMNPSLLGALARAYTMAGRSEDAARATQQARAVGDERAEIERKQHRLAALATALKAAAADGSVDEVDRLAAEMWPDAPRELRLQLLELRASTYDRAKRAEDAARVRAEAAKYRSESPQ